MALVVGQNSYITLEDARAYAELFALDLPSDDVEAEKLLVRAVKSMDKKYAAQYIGYKKTIQQPLQWLRNIGEFNTYRSEGELWGYTIDSDGNPRDFSTFPPELGEAQVEMAVLIQNGADPFAQSSPKATEASDSIGDLSTSRKYSKPYAEDTFSRVKTILRPLLMVSVGLKATRGA